MRPRVRTRDPGGRREYPWHVPFERAVRHLRPGRFDPRVLDQREVWVDSASRVHRLRSLSDDHLAGVIAMLHHTAVTVFLDYSMAAGLGRFVPPLEPPSKTGDVRSVAQHWLAGTPLWIALHAETARRNHRDRHQRHRLGSSTGMWAVRTEGATYVLDLDHQRIMHVGAVEDPRSGSPTWRATRSPAHVRVGRPLRADVEPAHNAALSAGQLAWCVVSIHRLPADDQMTPQGIETLARLTTRLYSRVGINAHLTEFRTPQFLDAASEIRILWAALDLVIRQHGVSECLLVPRRLRDAGAQAGAVDLLPHAVSGEDLTRLQGKVDEVLGYQLPIAQVGDYAPRSLERITEHAVPLTPGI